MILSNSTLDIFVNGNRVDILNRSSINLRINNVVYNPTEINSTQAEYSFSFNLPTTPTNNRIFDYANELAKANKFKNVYKSLVYVDGNLIFLGSLRILSILKGFYNVNLVNVKINTVEDIFGNMTLNEVKWLIPFTGAESINVHNSNELSKVIFPLVSYGVFLKLPSGSELDYDIYTSKFKIDKYNKWYYESFSPSPNLLELVRKLFNLKGYKVLGDIFLDEAINNIYMSTNLDDKLIPIYNLGQPSLGSARISCEFSNYVNKNTGFERKANYLEHNLSFPYLKTAADEWATKSVNIYDLWSELNSKIIKPQQLYLFDDSSNCIVVPSDGLYKIRLKTTINLLQLSITALEYYYKDHGGGARPEGTETEPVDVQLNNSLLSDMPVEIQLVRNEDECELIHGAELMSYRRGDRQLKSTWQTAYPHELLYSAPNPTVSTAQYTGRGTDSNGRPGGRVERGDRPSGGGRRRPGYHTNALLGYMPKNGEFLAFDPWVNPNFIAGVSSLSGGTPSFIKNGYSWNKADGTLNNGRYNCKGYWSVERKGSRGSTIEWKLTNFNKNVLKNSPLVRAESEDLLCVGDVSGIVELHRNDVIMLKAVTRHLEGSGGNPIYNFDVKVDVDFEAYSPYDIETIDYQDRGWDSLTLFDMDLSIGLFLNNKTKVSDFINNFIKEFNLSYVNEDDIVYLNKLQFRLDEPKYALNLDDRVSIGESKTIEYPNSIQVKYKIDTEEWGFETTVPADKINSPNWKEYGDYGSDKLVISNEGNLEEVQLSTSYCWYDTFEVFNENDASLGSIKIPVISKFSYMIDGYSYEESMKYDGKGLPLRYWFRLMLATNMQVKVNGKYPVYLYTTTNDYKDCTLSYHTNGLTLLLRYFNIKPNLSGNYVSIKCYLTALEYELLKNGANVIFDSDIYIVSEILGFDAMGINQTELLLIKKN